MRVVKLIDNRVVSTKEVGDHYVFEENEIQSNVGETGQIMLEDGTFITPEPTPIETQETLEQKIERQEQLIAELRQRVEQDNLIQFEVLATIYEELLMKG